MGKELCVIDVYVNTSFSQVQTPEFSKVPIKWALLPRISAQISVRRHLDSVGVGKGTPFFT